MAACSSVLRPKVKSATAVVHPKRCLFIAPFYYSATILFVQQAIEHMLRDGWEVYLIVGDQAIPFSFDVDTSNLRTITYSEGGANRYTKHDILTKIKRLCPERVDLIIGLSQYGIIYATLARRIFGGKVVYFNDELWKWTSEKGWLRTWKAIALKCLEVYCSRRADFVVTQDELRAQALIKLNRLSPEKVLLLPNSPARRWRKAAARSCPTGMKLTVQSIGSLPHPRLLDDIVRAAEGFPEGWTLEFQCPRFIRNQAYDKVSGRKNIRLYEHEFATNEEMYHYVDTADIGLVLYYDDGFNRSLIGKSSGKLNTYLSRGIPCIVSDIPGVQWLRPHNAAVMITSPLEIVDAVHSVSMNYDSMSKRALSAYDFELDFNKALSSVLVSCLSKVA